MTSNKILLIEITIFLILIPSSFSCKNQEIQADDYDVINQVMMKMGRWNFCLCDYTFEKRFFWKNNEYTPNEKKEIIKNLNKRRFNTDKVQYSEYDVILINDSLRSFNYPGYKSNKTVKLDIDRIISPQYCMLYQKKSIFHTEDRIKHLTFTRVLFNSTKDKAVFGLSYIAGGLNGVGINVFAEFKNGTWIISNIEGLWVS